MSTPTFGYLLKCLRSQAGLSQAELGRAVGYSKALISRLESNQRAPDLGSIQRVFVPALKLDDNPQAVRQLVELAAVAHIQWVMAQLALTDVEFIQHYLDGAGRDCLPPHACAGLRFLVTVSPVLGPQTAGD